MPSPIFKLEKTIIVMNQTRAANQICVIQEKSSTTDAGKRKDIVDAAKTVYEKRISSGNYSSNCENCKYIANDIFQ